MTRQQILDAVQSFEGIIAALRENDLYDILSAAAQAFGTNEKTIGDYPVGGTTRAGKMALYLDVIYDMKKNADYYEWLYNRLCDDESRRVFLLLLSYRLLPDKDFLARAEDKMNSPFIDNAVLKSSKNELILQFDNEDIPELLSYGKILYFSENADKETKENVTFIILNGVGSQAETFIGAKRHICDGTPKIAISLRNVISDMWELPKLTDSLHPEYRFFLRHYHSDGHGYPVFYAVPPQKEVRHNALKTAATFCPHMRAWLDVELTKDCGLIPYLLHKEYGMDVKMIGCSGNMEDYPSYPLVNGLQLVALNDYDPKTKISYIHEHARDIDFLILRGAYPVNMYIADIYKANNPEGIIYCGLDANSVWMDRICWTEPLSSRFIECCDILATSCTAMADNIEKKIQRKVYTITNGYYDFNNDHHKKEFSEKDNTILTVSRLGSYQKATNVLLEAFAMIARDIPEWNLKLVGNIEDSFKDYIDDYFRCHPQLRKRVIFSGPIIDKKALMNEYESAKIFALPSVVEGGAPNVIPEALTCGCATAVTKFDAWEDCINNGQCGTASNINDISGFAECMKKLCKTLELAKMSDNARNHANSFYNMHKNVKMLYDLINQIINE